MAPTKDRNHSGTLFTYSGENILFDCGEGIQRQLKIADISLTKITRIIISHWHGDHVLGLPGLMQSMSSTDYHGTLKIYGPKGTKKSIDALHKVFITDKMIDFEVHEIKDGEKIVDTQNLEINAYLLDHGVECYGFKVIEKDKRKINTSYLSKIGVPEGPILGKLQNGEDVEYKGKKIKVNDATTLVNGRILGIINDTAFCSNCIKIAKECDVLISEAAYDSSLEEKAEEYKHMTAKQAAQLASQYNVKKLILTHYSQRYKNTHVILEDAKQVFENTIAAHDFMKVKM